MAKKSMVERENKRKSLNSKYSGLRDNLKQNARKVSSFEEKLELSAKLQKLPRNSSVSRSVRLIKNSFSKV